METKGGRTGYRKPDAKGDRLTFRPTESLVQAIERHRFPGELTQPMLNRLLRNLAKLQPTELPEPDLWGKKPKPVSFRPEQAVYDFFRHWDAKFSTSQQTLESLVNLSTAGDVVEPLATAGDAYTFLVDRFGYARVEASQCLNLLLDYCSEKHAKDFLAILHKDGSIHLVQGQPKKGIERIAIGKIYCLFVDIRAVSDLKN